MTSKMKSRLATDEKIRAFWPPGRLTLHTNRKGPVTMAILNTVLTKKRTRNKPFALRQAE